LPAKLVLLLLLGLGARQAAGQAAATVAASNQLQATATEAAKAAAKGDKNTETLLHGQKQSTNMLRSMLMANSQQMFAINNLQKEVAKMRKRLDRHEEEVFKCRKSLDEYKSAQTQLASDSILSDTIEMSLLQVDEGAMDYSAVEKQLLALEQQNLAEKAQLKELLANRAEEEKRSQHSPLRLKRHK